MNVSPIRTRRWTRAEYYRLDELGIFHPTERIELVGGQIVMKERQSPAHASAINSNAPYGWRFGSSSILRPGDQVSPLAAPAVLIAVADLLP